jgi:hypothetical protein
MLREAAQRGVVTDSVSHKREQPLLSQIKTFSTNDCRTGARNLNDATARNETGQVQVESLFDVQGL